MLRKITIYMLGTLMFILMNGCTPYAKFTSEKNTLETATPKINILELPNNNIQETQNLNTDEDVISVGRASYYSNKFQNRKTANGEKYDKNELTAAHRSLPFGSLIQVTNLKNNKSVVVRINDRGPHLKKRLLDLSRAAAEELDMIRSGVVEVEVCLLSTP
jgi:rare lipoprotein A